MADQVDKQTLLDFAAQILTTMHDTLVVRGRTYADIADNSRVFAEAMSALGIYPPKNMSDVEFHCISNICTKLARQAVGQTFHEDNWIDIANYAVLIAAHMRREANDAALMTTSKGEG
jgi:hypothetical protein